MTDNIYDDEYYRPYVFDIEPRDLLKPHVLLHGLKLGLKHYLGNDHYQPSPYAVTYASGEKRILNDHDAVHMFVAGLPEIIMGNHRVDGIGGISIPEFHGHENHVPEYDGMLDEARIGFEHFCQDRSPINCLRAIYYAGYLASQGINPVKCFTDHLESRKELSTLAPIIEENPDRHRVPEHTRYLIAKSIFHTPRDKDEQSESRLQRPASP